MRGFATAGSERGPVTWAGLALSGLVATSAIAYYQIEKDRLQSLVQTKQKTVGKPAIGGPWTLVHSNGTPMTDASFRGKHTLLYFGFTRCPDICPSELVKVGSVLDQLDKGVPGKRLETLFISVDPQRDTLQQLRAYAADFHPTIQYLTGTKEQVAQVTKAYRVYFIKVHTFSFYFYPRSFFGTLKGPHAIKKSASSRPPHFAAHCVRRMRTRSTKRTTSLTTRRFFTSWAPTATSSTFLRPPSLRRISPRRLPPTLTPLPRPLLALRRSQGRPWPDSGR